MTIYRRIISSAAIAAAFAVGAAPALAQPVGGFSPYVRQEKQVVSSRSSSAAPTSATYSRQDKQLVSPTPASSPSVAPSIVRVSPSGGSFDWGDAGVGAAGGFALSMLGIGGLLARSQRRTRQGATALTS